MIVWTGDRSMEIAIARSVRAIAAATRTARVRVRLFHACGLGRVRGVVWALVRLGR